MVEVRPILSGLIAFLVIYVLARLAARGGARRQEGWASLSPGRALQGMAVVVLLGSGFVAYAATRAGPGQEVIAAIVAIVFALGAIYLSYSVFFTRFRWNDDAIESWHLLGGTHRLPWSDIAEGGYNRWLQAFWIRGSGGRRVWYSPLWQGIGTFHAELERRVAPVQAPDRRDYA